MLDHGSFDAVVFDIGGVFLVPHHEIIGAALRDAGLDVDHDPERWHRAHSTGVRALTDVLGAEGSVNEHHLDIWAHYDAGFFGELGYEHTSLDIAVSIRDGMRRNGAAAKVWSYPLRDNIEAFAELVAAGVACAIVSNNDGTAEEQLVEHGVCQVGDGPLPSVAAVVDSGVVGIAKPDPAIFGPALAALGTDPTRTLYVGDTVHADVRGATAADMPVVQLDPHGLHSDHDHHRVADVAALAALLLA